MIAAVFGEDAEHAQRLGLALQESGRDEARELLEWLGDGSLLLRLHSGLNLVAEAPHIARAGALGSEPGPRFGSPAQPSGVGWAL